ncbi:MAG: VCBS repeat-containing protein, partial [Ignavibacteriales bacterium]|nr:VCBS repeat-containing protein [Ignavibacteriales bacterium]
MKLFNTIFALLVVALHLGFAQSLTPDKTDYLPLEPITITFAGGPGNASDWIAIYIVGDATQTLQAWYYVGGAQTPGDALQNGSVTFPDGRGTPNAYEARFLVNGGYTSIATTTFTVSGPTSVTTTAATSVGETNAIMNASVYTSNLSSVVRFLRGTTPGVYTDSVLADQSPLTNSTPSSVTTSLTGIQSNTKYYYTASATNSAGYVRGSELNFTTFPLTAVSSVSPAANALNVSASTAIQITFNQAMQPGSFNDSTSFIVSGQTSGHHHGTIVLSGGNTIATFTPAIPFSKGELVVVQATSLLKTASDIFIRSYVYTFSAGVNTSPGIFGTNTNYSTGSYPRSVFVYDVDGDGDGDLAVANYSSATVSILMNNGDGTFAAKVDYGTGTNPYSVNVYDIDTDGDGDLVVANSATISVLKNDGNGTFAAKVDVGTGDLSFGKLFVHDMDGDGDGDIVGTNYSYGWYSVLSNNGDGTFTAAGEYPIGTGPTAIAFGDIDGDGDADLVTGHYYLNNTISVSKNNGNGTFASPVNYVSASEITNIQIRDVDGDGDADLITFLSNAISIFKNNGNGTFAAKTDYFFSYNSMGQKFVSDVDGDGDLDFASSDYSEDKVLTSKNNGAGVFAAPVAYSLSVGSSESIFISDLNNDGYGDIVLTNGETHIVSVLMQTFLPPTVTTNIVTNGFTTASMNGSVNPNSTSTVVRFLRGTSPGVYSDSVVATQSPVTGSSAASVSASWLGVVNGTTYYYRVAAQNSGGYAVGSEVSFTVVLTDSISGSAMQFDGTNDYISTGKSLSDILGSGAASTKSISVWIKPEGTSPSVANLYQGEGIIADAGAYWGIYRSNVSGTDRIWVYNWTGASSAIAIPFTMNEWMHIAMVHSGGILYAYKNGTLIGSIASGATTVISSSAMIGKGNGITFQGEVDELSMSNVGLTADQIRERMHTTLNSPVSGIRAYWQFNQGSGSVANDTVGKNNGTLTSFNFDATSGWMASTVPVSEGSSATVSSYQSGPATLGNVSLTMSDGFDNAVSVTATAIVRSPNIQPPGTNTILSDRYWVMNVFGTPGTYSANLTFTVPSTFTDNGTRSSGAYVLYRRNSTADGAWSAYVSGAASTTSTSVTFNGISSFGQYMIGFSSEPTVQASSITFSAVTVSGFTVNWVNGNGTKRIVVMKQGSAVDGIPVDNTTYTANTVFGSGTQIGSENYVVYAGTGNSAAISGLSYGTSYHAAVYEYFDPVAGPDYLTASPAVNNQSTVAFDTTAGYVLQFDGIDDQIVVTGITHLPSYTFEMWVKPAVVTNQNIFVTTTSNGPTVNWSGQLRINGGKFQHYLFDNNTKTVTGTTTVTVGEWYHVAITAMQNGMMRLYVNGYEEGTALNITSVFVGDRYSIGSASQGFSAFNGLIDELRLSSTALSADQLRSRRHNTLTGTQEYLSSYFQFNAGTGTAASDYVAGLTGTLSNFSTDAGSVWVSSTAPVGGGTNAAVSSFQTGTTALDNISITMSDDFDNAVALTASTINVSPNTIPSGTDFMLADRCWIINTYGAPGIFSANLTFTVPSTFTVNGSIAPARYTLYRRSSNSDGGWSEAVDGASSSTSSSITFNNVTSFGQFIIGKSNEPTVQATSAAFSSISLFSFTAQWANGNGSQRIVLMKSAAAVDTVPVDNASYTANAAFGTGSQIGTGNYVVYAGTGNSVAVTGLSEGMVYHLAVYEYFDSAGVKDYLVSTPAVGITATSLSDTTAGYALRFDGTNDYINTDKSLLNISGSGANATLSVMAWIKPTGTGITAGNSYAGRCIIGDAGGYWGIYRTTISGLDRIWIFNYDGSEDRIGIQFTAGEWMHVAFVHSGGTLTAYKNGTLIGSLASGNTGSIGGTVRMGMGYGANKFEGDIDEVSIWSAALTATQIRELMHTTINSQQSVLNAYWQFGEGNDTSAFEFVGNNHGTLFFNG